MSAFFRAILLALVLTVPVLSPPAAGAQMVGLPNPASQFCVSCGGELSIRETPAGQSGVCVFEGGFEIDEWSLYYWFFGQPWTS